MTGDLVRQLRHLILDAAPEPARAAAIMMCPSDAPLDQLMPFSSLIVLGTVVAVEERFRIRVTREDLTRIVVGGVTLQKLAALVESKCIAGVD